MNPAVTVIIPTYNRARFVGRAIESVLSQTCQDFELIVLDDGSTDATAPALARFDSPRLRLLRHERNLGAAAARNTALRNARADAIAFLDDDDVWLPAKLETQLGRLQSCEGRVGLVHCGSAIVAEQSGRIVHTFAPAPTQPGIADLLRTVTFNTSVPLIRSVCFRRVGLFDESLPAAQDRDMWIRIARDFDFASTPEVLVHRHIHGDQISSDLPRKIAAKERFAEKYHEELRAHGLLGEHLRRLGQLRLAAGLTREARRAFWRAAFQSPFRWGPVGDLVLAVAAPQGLRRSMLRKRIAEVEGTPLYY